MTKSAGILFAGLCGTFGIFATEIGSAGGAVSGFRKAERVTFLGDSITHGGSYHVDLQLYWDLRHPGSGTRLMNCGISGESATNGVRRWSWDVVPQQADRVFVMFGMNDVGRDLYGQGKEDETTLLRRTQKLADYETSMACIADLVRAAGQKLVVMTPTPFDEYGTSYSCANSEGCNEPGLAACSQIGRRLVASVGAEIVELNRPLTEFVRREGSYCFCNTYDRVHPRDDGHLIIMAEILKAMRESSDFCGADIDAKGSATVELDYQPTVLPFPVTDEYLAADRVYPLTDTVNREILTVRNLPSGRYSLTAQGVSMGEFSDGELRAGVNLALLPTPGAMRAKEAWTISRKVQNAQATQRALAFVSVTAADVGANVNDYDDVCQKVGVAVQGLKDKGVSYASYYEKQLAEYRANKPRLAEVQNEEARARQQLYEIGLSAEGYVIRISRMGGGIPAEDKGHVPVLMTK